MLKLDKETPTRKRWTGTMLYVSQLSWSAVATRDARHAPIARVCWHELDRRSSCTWLFKRALSIPCCFSSSHISSGKHLLCGRKTVNFNYEYRLKTANGTYL